MAFLFKSKKNQDRALASRDGNSGSQASNHSATARAPRDEKAPVNTRSTPTGSLTSLEQPQPRDATPTSPDRPQPPRRGPSIDQAQAQPQPGPPTSDLPLRNGPPIAANMNASLYPWSQRRITYTSSHPSPFPRYGAAVNGLSSKEGDIYLMGGLINSSTVKGDLWLIEAGGNMACYPLATTAEGPGPRVGHSSLLVGNAFIVYGGDTKIDESDVLDETLYLLNTSTRQWSRALPAGPRPAGRYGHSLNILGSKIFIFGGQVEDVFMNDLSAFDLNQLQMPNNRWEILLHGDPSAKSPAARTNHSMVTYNDKMYLFGGTNGFQWFNDVWCYDSPTNKWIQLDCIGYIPAPREGHAAALVDDVMYIFGGRTEEGTDLGDLAAFRISSRRWYTFQNMGPSPSPRSGHSMTTVGKSIVTLGGEPSSAATAVSDLGVLYVLDTTKIRYPTDAQAAQQGGQRLQTRPSVEAARSGPVRDGSNGPPDQRKLIGATANVSNPPNGHRSPPNNMPTGTTGADGSGLAPTGGLGSKLPRTAQNPTGPPPQGPPPNRPVVDAAAALGRVRGASGDRNGPSSHPQIPSSQQQSPVTTRDVAPETEPPMVNGRRTPIQQPQPPRAASKQEHTNPDGARAHHNKPIRSKGSIDSSTEPTHKISAPPPASPPTAPAPTRQPSNALSRRSSQRNSQTVVLLKELDSSRNRNAWYASELELARKAGYVSNAISSTVLDGKHTETFDDEDRPLVEALLAMRTELATVQGAVDKQAALASKHVAEAEKQRDTAIQEALYAKAKLAAYTGGSGSFDSDRGDFDHRSDEYSRKFSSALHTQKDLQSRLDAARTELEVERRARQLADDTTNAAQKRMADLEAYKQKTSTEVERLKAELHLAQREAREHSVASADAVAALELLKVEKQDISEKYNSVVGSSKEHKDTFGSLRIAIAASEDAKAHFQIKLDAERAQRELIESKLTALKAEHEIQTAELVATTERLRDAEEMAEKHANEAKTHRQAVLAGLDKISLQNEFTTTKSDTEHVAALQNQVAASNALVKKYQQEADAAADRLRSAEERIAGLEQYQEQSSREGVAIRRQLQAALRDAQALQATNTDLKSRLAGQQHETNAMMVQHSALKNILSERGISPTSAIRSRGLASPRDTSPEQSRMRDLESQLASANAAHEETKTTFAIQAQESETAYREKLSQLESDYSSAVHYVKGTEKMLKQLKDQLARYKTENGKLKSEIEELEDQLESEEPAGSEEWEAERVNLQKKVGDLEAELRNSSAHLQKELEAVRAELSETERRGEDATRDLSSYRKNLEQVRAENAILEQRATDAEQKVALLLDQVEHSVDTYRRQSRQLLNAEAVGTNGNSLNHQRNDSSESESVYGGNQDARNSTALDNLASELETLRSHWEATNKNYRLSTNFDLDSTAGKKEDDGGVGLSESLADWRKKLDPAPEKTRHV